MKNNIKKIALPLLLALFICANSQELIEYIHQSVPFELKSFQNNGYNRVDISSDSELGKMGWNSIYIYI